MLELLHAANAPGAPPNRLHLDLASLLEQHGGFRDQRHLMLLARMVAGRLLSQSLRCDRWKTVLLLDTTPQCWATAMAW
jgi:hypothetical protein